MDYLLEENWFAVQSKPKQENLAAASLALLDVGVFLPRIQREQPVCGVWRPVTKPLFPGYLFARFCPLLLLDTVRYALGVLRIVGNSRSPLPVGDNIISQIQSRVQMDGFIRLQQPTLQPGDKVVIEHGPLAGWIGEVEREWDDGKRVSILLEALQQARVLVQKQWVARSPAAA